MLFASFFCQTQKKYFVGKKSLNDFEHGKSVGSNVVWTNDLILYSAEERKVIQVLNDMRVSKYHLSFQFQLCHQYELTLIFHWSAEQIVPPQTDATG